VSPYRTPAPPRPLDWCPGLFRGKGEGCLLCGPIATPTIPLWSALRSILLLEA
jgi:hypothetical protein